MCLSLCEKSYQSGNVGKPGEAHEPKRAFETLVKLLMLSNDVNQALFSVPE
ncbi:MAG: hypothetical protein GY757_58525 [bacterium]|nr:hypothetical protein [bacterium]